jgi:hypothetical protein
LVWTIGAAGAAIVAKLVIDEWRRVNRDLDRMRRVPATDPERTALPTLRRDPVTGVYRIYR